MTKVTILINFNEIEFTVFIDIIFIITKNANIKYCFFSNTWFMSPVFAHGTLNPLFSLLTQIIWKQKPRRKLSFWSPSSSLSTSSLFLRCRLRFLMLFSSTQKESLLIVFFLAYFYFSVLIKLIFLQCLLYWCVRQNRGIKWQWISRRGSSWTPSMISVVASGMSYIIVEHYFVLIQPS